MVVLVTSICIICFVSGVFHIFGIWSYSPRLKLWSQDLPWHALASCGLFDTDRILTATATRNYNFKEPNVAISRLQYQLLMHEPYTRLQVEWSKEHLSGTGKCDNPRTSIRPDPQVARHIVPYLGGTQDWNVVRGHCKPLAGKIWLTWSWLLSQASSVNTTVWMSMPKPNWAQIVYHANQKTPCFCR